MSDKPLGSGWKSRPRPDRDPPLDLSGMQDETGTFDPDCPPPGLAEWRDAVNELAMSARGTKALAAVYSRAGAYLAAEHDRANARREERLLEIGHAFTGLIESLAALATKAERKRELVVMRTALMGRHEVILKLPFRKRPQGEPEATQRELAAVEHELGIDPATGMEKS